MAIRPNTLSKKNDTRFNLANPGHQSDGIAPLAQKEVMHPPRQEGNSCHVKCSPFLSRFVWQ